MKEEKITRVKKTEEDFENFKIELLKPNRYLSCYVSDGVIIKTLGKGDCVYVDIETGQLYENTTFNENAVAKDYDFATPVEKEKALLVEKYYETFKIKPLAM